jgi:transposase InsO family protein
VPWKTSRPVDLKTEFVQRLLKGERMTDLCAEFGISRETGYEVKRRYESGGVAALMPRSHKPMRVPHRTPEPIIELLVDARRAHPTWGGKKLKQFLETQQGVRLPAASTITDILTRRGLIEKGRVRRRVFPRSNTGLREATAPNHIWCGDYKGQFRLGDQTLCYPLTITDQATRYLLCCEGMAAISDEAACDAALRTFEKYGLPEVIRTDNGVPFASTGLGGLTRLSVLWLRLGIELERIEPGRPDQNGRHERMHRTLKRETTRPPGQNLLQQQERFDSFQVEFNNERPHEALGQKPPATVYEPSPRQLPGKLPEPDYPLHDDVLTVTKGGHVRIGLRSNRQVYLSAALAGQQVGVRECDPDQWLITFMKTDLGHINAADWRFVPLEAE